MLKKILLIGLTLALLLPRAAAALSDEDLLLLIAMPLVVAEVAELEEVPDGPLFNLVALLNQGNVPPRDVVEIIRFVPVVLVDVPEGERPEIVQFVSTRVEQGLRGTELATVIHQELRARDVPVAPRLTIDVTAPHIAEVRFVPEVVLVKVKAKKPHPHGGPPGQLKKLAPARVVVNEVRRDDDDDRDERKGKGKHEKHEKGKSGKSGKGKKG